LIDKTDGFVEEFAKDGLRTLFLGKRVIDPEEYNSWNKKFEKAQLSTQNREENVAKVNGEIEENI
jgi:hypothetical protein